MNPCLGKLTIVSCHFSLTAVPISGTPDQVQTFQDAFEAAVQKIQSLGATIKDEANIPSLDEWLHDRVHGWAGSAEFVVLTTEFKRDIAAYLKEMTSSDVRTLEDIVK
jgi:amidase